MRPFDIGIVIIVPGGFCYGVDRSPQVQVGSAIENIREAIELHLEALRHHNQPIPPESFDAFLVAV